MVKKTLMTLTLSLFVLATIAQQANTSLLSNPLLKSETELKDIVVQIESVQNSVIKNSRNNAEVAKEKLSELYSTYEEKLQNQKTKHLNDSTFIEAINEELKLVSELKTSTNK